MTQKREITANTTIVLAGAAALVMGVVCSNLLVASSGVVCLTLAANRWNLFRVRGGFTRRVETKPNPTQTVIEVAAAPECRPSTASTDAEPRDMESYVAQLLSQGRYMLTLRPQIAENLKQDQVQRAIQMMHEEMALVPEGQVLLRQPDFDGDEEPALASGAGQIVAVQPFYLDRYPVTNQQFKRFVDAGGYEESALWEPSILAAVLDFVDETGHAAPRFWRDGTYPLDLADHPVVGISWYEAVAYARWTGKRLIADPEWVKAGTWPVPSPGTGPQQRKYPWGNSMDARKANLWSSGLGTTAPVTEYPEGVSVGSVYQLIGNVWEWTTSSYGAWHAVERKVESPDALKSLRGGAFDTYFDSHAVCQFQSGDHPLARKHNIGFRCALGICDLTPLALQMPSR